MAGPQSRLASSPTNDKTDLDILMENRVTVGIGQSEAWEASNLRFDIGWVSMDLPDPVRWIINDIWGR
jgi:hypothetical protein